MSKRKSSNDLDRPMPKQAKVETVEIETINYESAQQAFASLLAGDILSKRLIRQKCRQLAKAHDIELDKRTDASSIVFDIFKNLFTKSLRVVQQFQTDNIIIFSDVYDVSRDKIQTFVAKCLAAGWKVSAFEKNYPKLEFKDGYKPQKVKIMNGGYEQLYRGKLIGLIIGEDEHHAQFGGGLDDEYAYWTETERECGRIPVGNPFDWNYGRESKEVKCLYNICGGAKLFASDTAANYCLCDTKYDYISPHDYCGMSPDKYDITQEQVDMWNEVVRQIHAEQILKDLATEFCELGPVPNNVRIYVQDRNYCKYFDSSLVTGTVLGQTVFYLETEVSGVSVQWLIFFDKNGKPHWKHDTDFGFGHFSACMENDKCIWSCNEDKRVVPFVDNVEGIAFDWRTADIDNTCQIDLFIGDEWFQVCDKTCDCEYCHECDGPLACHVAREAALLQASNDETSDNVRSRYEQHPLRNDCPYSICGTPNGMFSSDGAGNYCLCDTPYDSISPDDDCGMSPDKYDITHEQVDRWNEVVPSIIEARHSGLTYRQWFWTDRKKQALQAKQEVQATIYQEFERLPPSSTRRYFQSISRKGQPKMRQELLNEFNSACPATGENNEEYLEAAHLVPFRDIQHCESSNGLLLDLKIHKALDSGHLTYNGLGQLWRHRNFNIQHLHICCVQLPVMLLTDKRKKWLEQAYRGWLKHHDIKETELCKVCIIKER